MKRIILGTAIISTLVAFSSTVIAAPTSLEGLGMVKQWTDYEQQTGDMPSYIWGTSDASNADRIGLHVKFMNGLEGSVTYSGVSGLWNSYGFNLTPDTVTGFFNNAGNYTHLFNQPSSTLGYPDALSMAWNHFVMDFSTNFDLDYNNYSNSNFRATTSGWDYAEFATYSSAYGVNEVPIPAAAFMFAPALLGFMGLRRRAKNKAI